MRAIFVSGISAAWFLTTGLLFALGSSTVEAKDMKFEVQLLWGTDTTNSPNPGHKSVEPEVKKKLNELPLKWSNYFQVESKVFVVSENQAKKQPLEKCAIEIKNLGRQVEVALFDKKGEQQRKITQALPKGEILIWGGNAPNSTSWLVVIKRLE